MQKKSVWTQVGRFLFLLILVNLVGYIASSYMTADTLNWYHALPNSPLTPPDWAFGIVWSVLFFMMALSYFLVWGRASPRWFVIQLLANMLWSFCFFYLRSPLLGFICVLFLTFALIMNIRSFSKVSKISGLLLVPTLLWCVFALYLNGYLIF
jgi:tryptophan-rich sensory protein